MIILHSYHDAVIMTFQLPSLLPLLTLQSQEPAQIKIVKISIFPIIIDDDNAVVDGHDDDKEDGEIDDNHHRAR